MFKTYSASAGSGKTFNLVVEYLTVCFKNLCVKKPFQSNETPSSASRETFRKILAMTFTNNAAAEMKQRIMDVLKELVSTPVDEELPNYHDYYKNIITRVFGDPLPISSYEARQRIQRAAQLQLQSILYDYDRFAVTTIDSFNQRIIRSSALRLGLNLSYSVEIDLEEFYLQVVNEVLDDLRSGDKLTSRIMKYLRSEVEEKGSANVEFFLLSTLKLLYGNTEDNYKYLARLRMLDNALFEQKIEEWRKFVYETVPNDLKSNAVPFCQKILNCLKVSMDKTPKSVNDNLFKAVSNWVANPTVLLNATKYTSNVNYINKLVDGLFLNKGNTMDDDSMKIVRDEAEHLSLWVNENLKKYFNYSILLKNADKLLIIFDMQKKMDQLKEIRGLFFLSESNIMLHEELSKTGDDSPVIYENLGFHHFFLDEFQDTSIMQWDNMKPLISNNALSETGDAFLFGDVKQAIYRWRNGDAQILQDLSSFVTQNAHGYGFTNLSKSGFQKEVLDNNFRTLKKVVEFNNDFFKNYAAKAGNQEMYQDVKQIPHQQDSGLVEVFFYNKNKKKTGKNKTEEQSGNDYELQVPNLPKSFSQLKEFAEKYKKELKAVDFEILFAVQDALNRGYSASDIMLLFRYNRELTNASQWLIRYGLQVETKKSLLLSEAPEVMVIIETLKLLKNPNDNLAKANIIITLAQLADLPDVFSENVFSLQRRDEDFFQSFIKKHFGKEIPLNEWRRESLWVIIANIISTYKLNELKSPFIHDFLDYVFNFLAIRNDDVALFLDRWEFLMNDKDKKMPSIQSYAKQNAVKLMSIHGSKGKESPVVIYPSGSATRKPLELWTDDLTDTTKDKEIQRVAYVGGSESLFMVSDFAEEYSIARSREDVDDLNVTYVAHTRAKDILYLVAEQKDDDKKVTYSQVLRDFVLHAKNSEGNHYFIADESINNHFFVGDINWVKRKKKEKVVPQSNHPAMTVSNFSISDLVVSTDMPDNDPRAIGTKVHEYLSRLISFPQNEAEVESALRETPELYQPYLEKFFHQIISDPELKLFYGPDAKAYNEITIMISDKVTKRPDRVAFLNGQVRVYDYKTGHDDPEYKNQLEEYCQLIREMGYEDVQGRLIFLNL
ncbi:MAG: UvrD-helicase domain-containing protein [Bacteroidales bacterium]|nr:UvrD-helicase domain-containing protein [Bacteroidales bacterium]